MATTIKSEIEVQIPKGFFTYDVAAEVIHCAGCNKAEPFAIVNVEAKKRAKKGEAPAAPTTTVAGVSPKSRFTDFMNHHASCAIKAQVPTPRG